MRSSFRVIVRRAPSLKLVNPPIRQRIRCFVARIPVMSLHPLPRQGMPANGFIQLLPQILIFYGFLVRRLPAALFPPRQPVAHPVHNVFRIGVQNDIVWIMECIQRLDGGCQFHAVIRCFRFAAMQGFTVISRNQQNAPAAGSRITSASPVSVYLNCSCQNGFAKLWMMVLQGYRRLSVERATAFSQAST